MTKQSRQSADGVTIDQCRQEEQHTEGTSLSSELGVGREGLQRERQGSVAWQVRRRQGLLHRGMPCIRPEERRLKPTVAFYMQSMALESERH